MSTNTVISNQEGKKITILENRKKQIHAILTTPMNSQEKHIQKHIHIHTTHTSVYLATQQKL